MKLTKDDLNTLIDIVEDTLYELKLEQSTSNREFVLPVIQEQTKLLSKLKQLLNELTP